MKGLIFTYALTVGGTIAGLINPYVGFLVYVAFSILKPDYLWSYSVPQGNYSRIVAVALLIGWLLRGCGNWELGRAKPIVLALFGYAGCCVASASAAPYPELAWHYIIEMSKIFLPFLVGITCIRSIRDLRQLAWVIMLSEAYVAWEMNLSYFSGFNQLQELGFGGMDNNCNVIAMVTCLGLAFFLGLGAPRWWQRVIAFGSAAVLTHAVFIAFSRGGMVAMIVSGVASFFLIPKRFWHYVFFAAAVVVVLRMAGPEVRARFSTTFSSAEERDSSAGMRIRHWKACEDSMEQHPLLGVGPGHWHTVSPSYGLPPMEAHSLWLQVGAEVGVPALSFLFLFYLICIVRLWPLARESHRVPHPWLRDVARMVIAALIGFMVSAQFVSLQGLEVPYYVTLLGAGALKLCPALDREAELILAQAGGDPRPKLALTIPASTVGR
jgi:O-antigen ligase